MFDELTFTSPVSSPKYTDPNNCIIDDSSNTNKVQPNHEDDLEKDLMSLETSSVSGDDDENIVFEEFSINPQDYKLNETIGYGSSAVVHLATFLPRNIQVAIKIIDLDRFEKGQIDTLRKEIQVMSLCRHENLLRVLASFVNDSQLWIVTPFCSGGSCLDLLRTADNRNGIMNEAAIATILWQALQGLAYLHSNGHIHRDIKAGNLLLNLDGSVQLADFGVSSSLTEGGNSRAMRKTFVGTPCWMAPEVMEMTKGYDNKADIWSFGITAYELANGHAPYAKLPAMKVIFVTLSNEPPKLNRHRSQITFSKSYKDLISLCLNKDPSKRPTAECLLKHPFFKQARKKEYLSSELLMGLEPIQQRARVNLGKKVGLSKTLVNENPNEDHDSDGWDFSSATTTTNSSLLAEDGNHLNGTNVSSSSFNTKRGRFFVESGPSSQPSSPQLDEASNENDSGTGTLIGGVAVANSTAAAEVRKGRFSVNANEPIHTDSVTSPATHQSASVACSPCSPHIEVEEEGRKSRFEVVLPPNTTTTTTGATPNQPSSHPEMAKPVRTSSVIQTTERASVEFPFSPFTSVVSPPAPSMSVQPHNHHHHQQAQLHLPMNHLQYNHQLSFGHHHQLQSQISLQWHLAHLDQLLHMNELMKIQLLDLKSRLQTHPSPPPPPTSPPSSANNFPQSFEAVGIASPTYLAGTSPSGLASPTSSQVDLRSDCIPAPPRSSCTISDELERQLNQLKLENEQLRRRLS